MSDRDLEKNSDLAHEWENLQNKVKKVYKQFGLSGASNSEVIPNVLRLSEGFFSEANNNVPLFLGVYSFDLDGHSLQTKSLEQQVLDFRLSMEQKVVHLKVDPEFKKPDHEILEIFDLDAFKSSVKYQPILYTIPSAEDKPILRYNSE
jgi:hypothetical protein